MIRKYITAVFVAIIILVINQSFIQYFLYNKKYDARTINLAGRQRMLSQKINLEFYKIVKDDQATTELSRLFEEWKSAHFQLLNTPEESQLSPIVPLEAQELMTTLSSRITVIEQQLNRLQSNQDIDLALTNANQAAFLAEMETVVKVLEASSSDKLRFIVRIEIFLLLLSIVIISVEAIFIFYPIHKRLLHSLEELTQSKEALQANLVELKSKNHELEQFVSVASHDLQEPLRTVISFSQILQRKYGKQSGEAGQKEVNFIIAATKRMKALISDLLDYTDIGKSRTVKTIDCSELVYTVKQDLQMILEEKKASLIIEKLPTIIAYETEIRQLFQNLIINALKFQQAEIQPRIVVSAQPIDNGYQFSVEDNGIGIAAEFQEQIFLIFKRLHTIDQYQGTGIGLANCKKIVELHNGRIWVDSKEGEGSVFHFTIGKSVGVLDR